MSKEKEPNLSYEFLRACQAGDLSKVKNLVSKYSIENWTVFRHKVSGDTPLHVAAREGHLNVVEYLCDAFERPDFKVDVANKDMKRPLHEAAQFARSHVLRYLVEKGASVDCLKRADWTPLMLACTKIGEEAQECIGMLLEAKADPLRKNKDGWIPAFIVCRAGDVDGLQLLLKYAPESITVRSNNGRSALHVAAFNGHEAIIELLASKDSALLNAPDSSGATPLHEAVKGGNLNALKRMIRLGANYSATDHVGQTILHVASLVGNVETIEYILTNKLIDVHEKALFDVTPLAAARRNARTSDAIDLLIKYGAER